MMKKQLIACSAMFLCLLTLVQCKESDHPTAAPPPVKPPERVPYDSAYICDSKDEPSVVISATPKHDDVYLSAHPGGRIFYKFSELLGSDFRDAIRRAMDEWENKVEYIQFVNIADMSPEQRPREASYHYIAENGIKISDEAETTVGFIGAAGAEPSMRLGTPYINERLIKHELGHMIGLYHEAQRPDALNYIKYRDPMLAHIKNLQPAAFRANYELAEVRYINNPNYNVLDRPFDYFSIMIYDSYIYGYPSGKDLWTYMRKSDCKMTKPDEISNITATDVKKVKDMYTMKAVVRNEAEYAMNIMFYGPDNQHVHTTYLRGKDACFIDYDPRKASPFSLTYYEPLSEDMLYTTVTIARADVYYTSYEFTKFKGSLKFVKDAAGNDCIDFTGAESIRMVGGNRGAEPTMIGGGGAGVPYPQHPSVESKRLFTSLNSRKHLNFSFRNGIPESSPAMYVYCTVAGYLQRNQRSAIPSYFPDATDRLNEVVNDIIDRNTYADGNMFKVPIYFVMILDDDPDENYARNADKSNAGNRYAEQVNYPTDNGTGVNWVDPSLPPLFKDPTPEPFNITLTIPATRMRDELKKK